MVIKAVFPLFRYDSEPSVSTGILVYAPLRSAQSRCPLDILRPNFLRPTCSYTECVFCKPFLQKIAKHFYRLLQNTFVGCCTYILQVIAITFAGRLRPAKSFADILITDYFALFLNGQKVH